MTLSAKYGLPQNVFFCKKCVMSNQKPHSVNETTHTPNSKKTTLGFILIRTNAKTKFTQNTQPK